MARPKKQENQEEEESSKVEFSSKDFLKAQLNSKEIKPHHFNNEVSVNYTVSTGSLILDKAIGGGYRPGLQRMCGASGGGKTSHTMDVCTNFLKTVPRSKAFYVKAEGRLSKNIIERQGLKVVFNGDDWDYGSVFIFESNVYEVVFDLIRNLLKQNQTLPPEKREHYFFIIDSMDGLITKGDLEKSSSEANKVAAGALLQSDFLKRVSLGMSKFGHMCFMMSQVRSKVSIDPYAPKDPNAMVNSSGGNAGVHYPDYILEFKRQVKTNKILPDAKAPISNDNVPVGHYVDLVIAKSDNENQLMPVKYPVKYGRVGRSAVWIEREIIEMLLMWGYITKGGAWFNFSEEVICFVKESLGIDMEAKKQGINSLYDYLEENQDLSNVLKEFVETNIMQNINI